MYLNNAYNIDGYVGIPSGIPIYIMQIYAGTFYLSENSNSCNYISRLIQ